jgi:hypothetical protein
MSTWDKDHHGKPGTDPRELEALRQLLDVHGADRTRWPARERRRIATLPGGNLAARRLTAEAEALDRLLDLAPVTSDERRLALAERIVARAIHEGRPEAGALRAAEEVVAAVVAPHRAAEVAVPLPSHRPFNAARFSTRRMAGGWPAATLLAASLLVGVLAGATGVVSPALQSLPGLASLEATGNASASAVAAWDDAPVSDEDTL